MPGTECAAAFHSALVNRAVVCARFLPCHQSGPRLPFQSSLPSCDAQIRGHHAWCSEPPVSSPGPRLLQFAFVPLWCPGSRTPRRTEPSQRVTSLSAVLLPRPQHRGRRLGRKLAPIGRMRSPAPAPCHCIRSDPSAAGPVVSRESMGNEKLSPAGKQKLCKQKLGTAEPLLQR